ncbi:unnamed protein product [Angiostrongylus costaricensis]|uniref:Uncharacterized protein n=1 Tax=Angiostrongylus costaricensis TaxID=334426 RepID=A0A0R3PRJ3_ANGCS|nr:unnamed protein product [Angiostrongylus costaricensis]
MNRIIDNMGNEKFYPTIRSLENMFGGVCDWIYWLVFNSLLRGQLSLAATALVELLLATVHVVSTVDESANLNTILQQM